MCSQVKHFLTMKKHAHLVGLLLRSQQWIITTCMLAFFHYCSLPHSISWYLAAINILFHVGETNTRNSAYHRDNAHVHEHTVM